jgi:hypothetical protein
MNYCTVLFATKFSFLSTLYVSSLNSGQTLRELCDATLLLSRVFLREFLLQFPEEGRQRSKVAYRSLGHREHQSFLQRIHGTTSSTFADS